MELMDGVELNYPVNVSKLRVKEDCESPVTSSIECCRNSGRHKDGTGSVNGLESAPRDRIPDAELCKHAVEQSCCHGEELSELHNSKGTSCPEFVKVQRKAGRMSRGSGGYSKRPRVAPPEDTVSPAGIDDAKDITDMPGSSTTKCNPPEKTQMVKQRHSFGGKRGEKRNFKMSTKPKYESFSIKSGLANFGVGSGGNNFSGAYGLKSDVQDITKLVDDISLNELLDGTYECPSFGKDKGKKAAMINGDFLASVRKAWSVLPRQKPVQSQIPEIDSFPSKKLPICSSSPVSLTATVVNGDKEDCCPADLSSSNKDSCGKSEMPAGLLDFPLCQPKDVLERLGLPPPKDLELLLLDAAKPSSSSRNTSDLRSCKQISRRPSLPLFPWSHNFNGHSRTNSDVVKCLTSRTTCQGRWVKIAKAASSAPSGTCSFTDLETLTYDQSLVPLKSKAASLENRIYPSTGGLPLWEQGSPSLPTDSKVSQVPTELGSELKYQNNAGHCPRLLAAAETLCDIASNGYLRWPKKPSQKAMKARKSKLKEKSEEKCSTSSVLVSAKLVRKDVDHVMPSKRPKLSTSKNKKDVSHKTCVRKGTMPSPTPRSRRSSPGKSVRESIPDVRHSTATVVKQPVMMNLPATALDNACNSQPKLRKLMPVNWSRGRDGLD